MPQNLLQELHQNLSSLISDFVKTFFIWQSLTRISVRSKYCYQEVLVQCLSDSLNPGASFSGSWEFWLISYQISVCKLYYPKDLSTLQLTFPHPHPSCGFATPLFVFLKTYHSLCNQVIILKQSMSMIILLFSATDKNE